MARTTPEDFEFFKQCIYKYVDVFGMHEWDLTLKHTKMTDGNGDETITAIASCIADDEAMNPTIKLNKIIPDKLTKENLERTALHEVLELLLWSITVLIPKSYPEQLINKETHVVIQKVVNAFKRGAIHIAPDNSYIQTTITLPDGGIEFDVADLEGRDK